MAKPPFVASMESVAYFSVNYNVFVRIVVKKNLPRERTGFL